MGLWKISLRPQVIVFPAQACAHWPKNRRRERSGPTTSLSPLDSRHYFFLEVWLCFYLSVEQGKMLDEPYPVLWRQLIEMYMTVYYTITLQFYVIWTRLIYTTNSLVSYIEDFFYSWKNYIKKNWKLDEEPSGWGRKTKFSHTFWDTDFFFHTSISSSIMLKICIFCELILGLRDFFSQQLHFYTATSARRAACARLGQTFAVTDLPNVEQIHTFISSRY